MKKIPLFLVSILVCKLSFGKAVDEQSAKMTGYNFLKTEGVQADIAAMSLIYKTTSAVKGVAVNDFYVFSTGAKGFVIVSGDDNVAPVLGFSADDIFRAEDIPVSVNNWLNNYRNQINYVIEHNLPATDQTAMQWTELRSATAKSAAKSTATTVSSFVTTKWDQSGYYSSLCPYDAEADTNALTGCVATAMAQVMRYWKWPATGSGTHSYRSAYGTLTANFGATAYAWDSMPNSVYKANKYVATIMSQAGISVNMSYGTAASGAYVTETSSPITNCAEYALQTYFNYKPTMQGLSRYAYEDSEWINLVKTDIDAKRPVIYTGDGAAGGHCFVADGYAAGDRIHFNWGWSGYYNGYFLLSALAPGTETFNNDQTIIIGVQPDNPVTLGVNETAATTTNAAIYPNPAKDILNINPQGAKATKISLSDMQGRTVKTIVPVNNTLVTIPVSDFAPGMYFISLQTEQGIETKKVIIE